VHRMLIAVLLVGAAVLAPASASPATAADPVMRHIVDSVHADANFSFVAADGCLGIDIWASSGEATYSQPPGPSSTQGLTTIDIFVTDLCTPAAPGVMAAAGGGGGGTVVAAWSAQTLDPLVARPNLSGATLSADLVMVDEVSGGTEIAQVDLAWAPSGPIDHSTSLRGDHWPHVGMARGVSNWKIRDATVSGSIVIGDADLLDGADGIGHLERGKWHCIENVHPHWDGVPEGWCVQEGA
jgi:hypothetical protein